MKVKISLSDAQKSKLRNGHAIRVTPKMVGSGNELIIDPVNYHNLEKHLKKEKGMNLKLPKETIDENKLEGGALAKKMKKQYDKLPEGTKKNIRRNVRTQAKQAVDVGVDAAILAAPIPPSAKMATKAAIEGTNAKRPVKKQINKAVKRGLGLTLSEGDGLYAGSGHKKPKELFMLEQQNLEKPKLRKSKVKI